MGLISRVSSRTYRNYLTSLNYLASRNNMPASKKTLRNQQQKKNREAGVGDSQGRVASNNKTEHVMVNCTVCRTALRMIKDNKQAAIHVSSKHPGKSFADCFPGYTTTHKC